MNESDIVEATVPSTPPQLVSKLANPITNPIVYHVAHAAQPFWISSRIRTMSGRLI